jgi:hypothetical protein
MGITALITAVGLLDKSNKETEETLCISTTKGIEGV